jgi:hypothetical protein
MQASQVLQFSTWMATSWAWWRAVMGELFCSLCAWVRSASMALSYQSLTLCQGCTSLHLLSLSCPLTISFTLCDLLRDLKLLKTLMIGGDTYHVRVMQTWSEVVQLNGLTEWQVSLIDWLSNRPHVSPFCWPASLVCDSCSFSFKASCTSNGFDLRMGMSSDRSSLVW